MHMLSWPSLPVAATKTAPTEGETKDHTCSSVFSCDGCYICVHSVKPILAAPVVPVTGKFYPPTILMRKTFGVPLLPIFSYSSVARMMHHTSEWLLHLFCSFAFCVWLKTGHETSVSVQRA